MRHKMWRQLITGLTDGCTFTAPASLEQIEALESSLSIRIPDELRSLLLESNGVSDFLWSVERILADNTFFRTFEDYRDLFMPFDHLLFFADAGNGDMFGYAITGSAINRTDVFTWNHEDDSRSWKASSLKDFVTRWLNGSLAV